MCPAPITAVTHIVSLLEEVMMRTSDLDQLLIIFYLQVFKKRAMIHFMNAWKRQNIIRLQ